MNRRAPLILITEPQLVSSGLQPDRHGLFTPLWELADNARFYQGKVRRLVPPASMFDAGLVDYGRGLSQHQDSTGTRWVWGAFTQNNNMRFVRWYGPAPETVWTSAGNLVAVNQTGTKLATQADLLHWGDWTLMNLGIGPAMLFKPGEAVAALQNAPADVVQFLKKENQLMAIGHGLHKKDVSISDADAITVWEDLPDNLATSLTIEELDTGIRAATRLAGNIACYAEDQMAFVYRVGQPFIIGQRVMLDGIGAVGKKAVCTDGRLNYGISRNGLWQTDGNESRYIDAGALQDYLQENVNWEQASKAVATRNDVTRCLEFYLPMENALENSEGWAFDPQTGGWTKMPPVQGMAERVLFDKPLVQIGNGVLLLDDNPAGIGPLTLRTKPMLIQSAQGSPLHISSRIDEIELAVKTAVGIEFRYGVAENIGAGYTWSEWQMVYPDMRTYQLEELPTGTYHTLDFRSVITGWEFDLQGFALFGEPDGTTREQI